MGVNSLPKNVTRQRRDCDSNAGPFAPESSTLTTRLHVGTENMIGRHIQTWQNNDLKTETTTAKTKTTQKLSRGASRPSRENSSTDQWSCMDPSNCQLICEHCEHCWSEWVNAWQFFRTLNRTMISCFMPAFSCRYPHDKDAPAINYINITSSFNSSYMRTCHAVCCRWDLYHKYSSHGLFTSAVIARCVLSLLLVFVNISNTLWNPPREFHSYQLTDVPIVNFTSRHSCFAY